MKLTIGYLAGFFDGEGCVSIALRNGSRVADVRVIVTNTRREVLEAFEARFGGRVREKKRSPKDAASKPCFQWVAWNRHAEKALKALRPALWLKKDKAAVALALIRTMNHHGGPWRRFPGKTIRRREELLEAFRCA